MPTALVTGSEGFLGRYISAALLAAGWRVAGIDRAMKAHAEGYDYYSLDLPSAGFEEVLETVQPEAICHGAGPASVADSVRDPEHDYKASVEVTASLLEAVRRRAPECKVLFLSSAAVYGDPARLPIAEDAPHRPLSPYGQHKSQTEQLLNEYKSSHGVHSAAVRLFSAYGPGLKRQVMWDIARKVLAADEVNLFGTGEESRDFVHAHDVGRAVALLFDKAPFQAEAYNLAAGVETRICDLADMIAAAIGRSPRFHFSGHSRTGDPARWRADVTRITALGYRPEVTLADGVAEYAQWAASQPS